MSNIFFCILIIYHQAGDDDDKDGEEEDDSIKPFSVPHVVPLLALQDVFLEIKTINSTSTISGNKTKHEQSLGSVGGLIKVT